MTNLSPPELRTLESYKSIATVRNTTHADKDRWKTAFEEFRKLVPSGKILDLGCGAGRDAQLFIPAGYDYVGVDLSSEMILEAKRLCPGARFETMSMYSLVFCDHAFDAVWAAASLLHIPKEKLGGVLGEIKRVIRQGGIVFVSLKEGEGERVVKASDADERFFAFYSDAEFSKVLAERGFEVLHHARELWQYPDGKKAWLWYLVRPSSSV